MSTNQEIAKQDTRTGDVVALLPAVDVVEDESGITVIADLPGAAKKDLGIRVEGDTLTLDAPISLGESAQLDSVYAEVRAAHWRRSFTLSRELDSAKIEAALKDGVLTLHVPKLEHAKPRRIEVRVG